MSTFLPPVPSIQHLKKQAKDLLKAFRRNDPKATKTFATLQLKTAPKLADAQLLIATKYGFQTWADLKHHATATRQIRDDVIQQARDAFQTDDARSFRRILEQYPVLKDRIDVPVEGMGGPLITSVRSPEMLDVLLDAGADINAKSDWWAGGFSLLDCAPLEVALYAVSQGAKVTVHAAARLGNLGRLRELLDADPSLVYARGGDGQTPLHFASTVEVAAYLLEHGAEMDARDIDHESTPAQYMVRSRQDVARFLVENGCVTDILMAAALGDKALVLEHLEADPENIRMRVSDDYFAMVGGENGGTIYQWELGWYASAPQVARTFGHTEIFHLLMKRCPPDEKLLNACWMHDEALVDLLLAQNPELARRLSPAGRRHVAHAARNNATAAARLMLKAGLPVAGEYSQHHGTALHWAAWHGNAELCRLVLRRDPPLEDSDNEFGGTPLGWALHGSENSWHPKKGDYAATVEALLKAGAKPPAQAEGTATVQAVLRKHGAGG